LNGGGNFLMRLGIFGGTFDPPHNGHLQIAREALRILELDKVIFMVAGSPQLKHNPVKTTAEQRLAMTKLAINGEKLFEVSSIEIDRKGATYTVQTLAEIEKAGTGQNELFFIIGMDNLAGFKYWHKPDEIIKKCLLVVAPRPDKTSVDLEELEKDVPGSVQRLIILEEPFVDISSSAIRRKAAQGEDISCLVPETVAEYIKSHKLYAESINGALE